jgi:hypothetical protein
LDGALSLLWDQVKISFKIENKYGKSWKNL